MTDKIVVLVTCGTRREARRIARTIVERRLAACANLASEPVESIYRWKGDVKSAKEFLLAIKTTRKRFAGLRDAIQGLHSYDVPEIIAISVVAGSREYLEWIGECVAAGRRSNPNAARKSLRDDCKIDTSTGLKPGTN